MKKHTEARLEDAIVDSLVTRGGYVLVDYTHGPAAGRYDKARALDPALVLGFIKLRRGKPSRITATAASAGARLRRGGRGPVSFGDARGGRLGNPVKRLGGCRASGRGPNPNPDSLLALLYRSPGAAARPSAGAVRRCNASIAAASPRQPPRTAGLRSSHTAPAHPPVARRAR